MLNSKSQVRTVADSSNKVEQYPSSPNNAKPLVSGSFYPFPTLIEPIYNGNDGTAVKDYRVVGQDGCLPNILFYGSYEDCVKWRSENCH